MMRENQTIWQHLDELRAVILKSLAAIFLGFLLSLFFYQELFDFLKYPLKEQASPSLEQIPLKQTQIVNHRTKDYLFSLPKNSHLFYKPDTVIKIDADTFKIPPNDHLIIYERVSQDLFILGPLDGMTTLLKVCLFMGLAITSPFWLYQILKFIAPALNPSLYSFIFPFIALSLTFMSLGIAFAFFVTIPLANQYLYSLNQEIGINLWSLSNYLDYTIILLLGNGISFEMSVIAVFLVHYRVLSAKALIQARRYFIVAAFIISAILTPPDVLTQFLLALPLIALYECIILYAKFLPKLKNIDEYTARVN